MTVSQRLPRFAIFCPVGDWYVGIDEVANLYIVYENSCDDENRGTCVGARLWHCNSPQIPFTLGMPTGWMSYANISSGHFRCDQFNSADRNAQRQAKGSNCHQNRFGTLCFLAVSAEEHALGQEFAY